ncbi:MAG: hypothetical protein ABSH20_25415 [Tepidisphaeraceae bacterium]
MNVHKKDDGKAPESLETDERFPSGEWTGFWMQRSIYRGARSWMELQLTFAGGVLRGEGRDRIGEFTILGQYDLKSAEVTFTKTHPTHDVFYRGWAELDKGIWGLWKLPFDRDGFHIWPKGMSDPTGSNLKAEADAPVEEEEPALVGSDE